MNSDKVKTVSNPDRENCKKLKQKSSATNGVRNPLADICDNIIREKKLREVKRSTSTVKIIDAKNLKLRSNSASAVETKVNYYYKSENVTERKTINEIIDDEVFVKGEEHFLNYVSQEKYSRFSSTKSKEANAETEIAQPVPVVRITAPNQRSKFTSTKSKEANAGAEIAQPVPVVQSAASNTEKTEIKRPAQKINLVRKLSNRHKRSRLDELYANCYYDTDYFQDNYQYMLDMEKKFVFRKDLLKLNIDENYRMIIVNWLIYVQQILDLAENTFFVGIRMFDYLLLVAKVSCSKYILIGITCFWIANKNFDVHFIQLPKLFSICNGKFSRTQIVTMEREILKILRFNVNFSEPSSFLYYYLKRENLESDPKIVNSAMFLLETFTLLLDFSALTPSLLASMALYLVLVKYNMECTSFLDYVECNLLDKNRFVYKSEQMKNCVGQLLDCKRVSSEIVEKYSTEDRCCVARNFISK